jgi:hypothetical protein
METAKYGVWLLWFGSMAAFFMGDESLAQIGQIAFLGTFFAHLGEFVWKRPLFNKVGGDMTHHFIQTMIYGLFYWKPIEDGQAAG